MKYSKFTIIPLPYAHTHNSIRTAWLRVSCSSRAWSTRSFSWGHLSSCSSTRSMSSRESCWRWVPFLIVRFTGWHWCCRSHWRSTSQSTCQAQSQQSHQVHPLVVHAGEQGETECIPTVSKQSSYVPLNADYLCSLTQATETTNIRLVFAAVEETILQHAVMDSRILWSWWDLASSLMLSVVCCHCRWVFLYMYVRAILTILIVIDSRSFVTLHLPPLPNLPYIYTSSSPHNHQEAHYTCPLITTMHYPITCCYSYVTYIICHCF